MHTLRQQFDTQLKRAQTTVKYINKPLALVMVKHKGYATRISVIGNAINPGVVDIWRADGSNVRTLKIVNPA